ncbi:MAG: sensor histidine kinase [Anaerolineae bacterium]|nr:sensor histidine kinase [Anaerolineae bacterium]
MQVSLRSPRMNLRSRLALTHGAVTLVATLAAEGMALGIAPFIAQQAGWPFNAMLVSATAGLIGLILGAWVSHRLTRRLQRASDVSNAWLRGNLSIRIADPAADDLGLLTGKLDLLAEHLEHDEQDLDELRERNARLSDQVRALTVVEERNRLARELHDSVKQHLFSLAMTTSAIRTRFDALQGVPDDLAEMVREAETTAQTAQHEMTRLIEDLRPGSLQERGLATALNDYTLLFGAQGHILIYLEVQGNDALLPPAVAEALYRVAQEALHNVARHARATRADVRLHCIPEQVSLTIHDNGVGFDTTKARRGLGLANMEERMMAIGGRLIIESQVGIGTTVQAEVALATPAGFQTEIASLDKNRPNPTIENWAWLGQKLVIPVGQTWPWLPADQVHLRRPLVEATDSEPLLVQYSTGFLGFKRGYSLQLGQQRTPLIWIHRSRAGYEL